MVKIEVKTSAILILSSFLNYKKAPLGALKITSLKLIL